MTTRPHFAHLTITGDSPWPGDARVTLTDPDGSTADITPGLRSLRLVIDHEDVNRLELVMSVDGLQVDAAVLAALEAHLRQTADQENPPTC